MIRRSRKHRNRLVSVSGFRVEAGRPRTSENLWLSMTAVKEKLHRLAPLTAREAYEIATSQRDFGNGFVSDAIQVYNLIRPMLLLNQKAVRQEIIDAHTAPEDRIAG